MENTPKKFIDTSMASDGTARKTCRFIGMALISLALSNSAPMIAEAQDAATPILGRSESAWTSTVVAEGLDYPWDIVLGGERLILTEKAGSVVTVAGGELQRHTLENVTPASHRGRCGTARDRPGAGFRIERQGLLLLLLRCLFRPREPRRVGRF